MKLFLLTLTLTFPLFILAAAVVNFCKRRLGKTRHGLTGMCHETGDTMCCSCAPSLQQSIPKVRNNR